MRFRAIATAILSASVMVSAGACDGLKRAEEPPDTGEDGGEDGPPGNQDGSSDGRLPEGAVPDAGAPPIDFECDEPWTKATKTKTECSSREVKVIEAVAPIDVQSISIARTPAGRVGIVYNAEQGADEGEMHLMHFKPEAPSFPAPVLVKLATGFAFHDGYMTRIAASAPDTLSVLAYDLDDSTGTGEVNVRRLVAGATPLTAKETMFTAVQRPTELGFASDTAGNVYASVRISTGATTAKLAVKKKTSAGMVSALPDLATALLPQEAPGAGSASLFVDSGGQLHVLYHHNEVMQHSNPRYHALAGTLWTYRKTVDNAVIDGLSGYSPRIAVFGTMKFAAYFFRKAGQTTPATADLRLATWESEFDTPKIEIIEQNVPSGTGSVDLYPQYAVAMAVDKYGLVHLAIIDPFSKTSGVLEYRRQTRVAGGATKWLSDIVDPDVISDLSSAFVDLIVDENARPHIAYRSAKDGQVKYATRYDRP